MNFTSHFYNKQIEKLKLIYLPFLIIAVGVVGGYTYLHWQDSKMEHQLKKQLVLRHLVCKADPIKFLPPFFRPF